MIEITPLAEVNQQAIRLLYRELGPVNAVRFLKQYTAGFGNYTKERDELFPDWRLEEVVTDIKKRRKGI